MRLSEFVEQQRESIIAEWVKFAETLLPWAEGMNEDELRDHASEMLEAVVADMGLPQSTHQKQEKSRGEASVGALGKIGRQHASERLESGFDIEQLVSEYRALRASVLRLWEEAQGDAQGEVTRFNEAIDETLAESIARYSRTVQATSEQFLGILGHDLRNPLNAVVMGAKMLASSEGLDDKNARVAARMLGSAERMSRMVNDLLDLTRSRLGPGIPVTRKPMDLADICMQVISELAVLQPASRLRFEPRGDLQGEWDADRLAQVVSNLVSNALHYGGTDLPITVLADGQADQAVISVHNSGVPIEKEALKHIFEPMRRQRPVMPGGGPNPGGLGLGLYIAHEIVTAHQGTLEVSSSQEAGTVFTVSLPRSAVKTKQEQPG